MTAKDQNSPVVVTSSDFELSSGLMYTQTLDPENYSMVTNDSDTPYVSSNIPSTTPNNVQDDSSILPAETTQSADVSDSPSWSRILDLCQLTCTLIGFVANVLTLITLIRNHRGFSRVILILFRHQSIIDALVCAMASALLLQPPFWITGILGLDLFICSVWHGQAFYWGAVTLSTYNLILIACERYLAVCRPFKHGDLLTVSKTKLAAFFVFLYILCLVVTHGTYIQTKLTDGDCHFELLIPGRTMQLYYKAFVVFTYVVTYLLPAVVMATLYGIVSVTLNKRAKDTVLGHSKMVDRAGAQLTKTAIVVTVIFIITIGYDLHFYLLGETGLLSYEMGKPEQKVGVFLANLNSCLNPFVYALLMPIYRASLRKTFCCVRDQDAHGRYQDRVLTGSDAFHTPNCVRHGGHGTPGRTSMELANDSNSNLSTYI